MLSLSKVFNWNILRLLLYVFLFFYVAFRAYNLSFTHDESLSYTILKGNPLWVHTANNHLLNTFLMKAFSIFGETPFILRAPTVLAFALFLFYFSKIECQSKKIAISFFVIALILLNPFLLDFFSLARGYGLSLAFMMGSIYYLLYENKQATVRSLSLNLSLSAGFTSLAMFSNLAIVNYYIALLLIFLFQFIRNFKIFKPTTKQIAMVVFIFLLSLFPLGIGVQRLFELNKLGQLYYGADSFDGMWSSLIAASYYFSSYPAWIETFIKILIAMVFLSVIIILFFYKPVPEKILRIASVLGLVSIAVILQNYLFGALYPVGRTGIYFIPLLGIILLYLLEYFTLNLKQPLKTVLVNSFIVIAAIILSLNFIFNVNLKYTRDWKYDANTENAIILMTQTENFSKKTTGKLIVSNNWLFEPALNYYITSRSLNFEPANREQLTADADFIYAFNSDTLPPGFELIALFGDTDSGLYKKSDR